MNTEELKRLAEAATPGPWRAAISSSMVNSVCTTFETVCETGKNIDDALYIAAANPTAILALIEQHEAAHSELLATRDDNHSMMLEIEGLRKVRDKLLAAWKEYQNADFSVSCQRGVVGKCMCAQCTNDRASAVFARAEG